MQYSLNNLISERVHQGAKLLATLDYETGEVYCDEYDKYDAEVRTYH